MAKPYPPGTAVRVRRDEWMSLEEAAGALGVPRRRIAHLVRHDRLAAAETSGETASGSSGAPVRGVTVSSVQAELRWRATATRGQRYGRRLGDSTAPTRELFGLLWRSPFP